MYKFKLPVNLKIRKSYFWIGILIIFGSSSVFYKYGLMRYLTLRSEKNTMREKMELLEAENERLQQSIDSLKTHDSKIEKVAREKYKMIRNGEQVFTVEEK